ncbi:acyl carrier protein [Actinoallomurus oryzae]|uniref:Acyl carrier protein n=1 Tax=Actinoallomurus oryzae TaxID=502180 RepID=A0ABP8QNW2_9ACTN
MTPDEAQEMIEEALQEIAPGPVLNELRPDDDLRERLELDSLDFLNFVEALSDRAGRRIDEDDYPELVTIETAAKFLCTRE